MNENEDKASAIKTVIEQIREGKMNEDMCKVIRRYPATFDKVGIHSIDIMAMLKMKAKLTFFPDPMSYSIQDPRRVNYIYTNFDNPEMGLADENEKRFAEALSFYYSMKEEYGHRQDNFVRGINDKYCGEINEVGDWIVEDDAKDFLAEVLFDKRIPEITRSNFKHYQMMFDKYDLHNVYNMADNKVLLQWKAALAAEAEGFLDEGVAEVLFIDAGIDTDELENRITRYKIDLLRVSKAEVFTPSMGGSTYIRCRVDGQKQKEKKLSAADVAGQTPFVNVTGLAVKYFQNVLDRNRERNNAVADDKALIRSNTSDVERLVDIFHNGLSREDVMLLKVSKDANVDKFWRNCKDCKIETLENEPISVQKNWAFGELVHHMSDLRAGMLADDEIVRLTKISPELISPKREGEDNLMRLPESYFPLIEEAGVHQQGVISYVKVMRNIGRITPIEAYQSMCYYLENRMETAWNPVGGKDEHEQVTGCYYYPNECMSNPAERFPSNLLNEKQWNTLRERFPEGENFIPDTAFRMNRITEVQIYPLTDGGFNIRCMVDGEQQNGRRLSEVDAERCMDEKTDKRELAVGYFMDAFARESEKSMALER